MRRLLSVLFYSVITATFVLAMVSVCSAKTHKGWFGWRDAVEGSGNLVTEEREVDSFINIDAGGSFDVEVKVGPKVSLKLTFDDNIIKLIDTRVRGKTLYIDTDESYSSHRPCKVEITVPLLESVSLNGSGDLDIQDVKGELLDCEVNGSGNIVATGEVDELDVDISGSGDVDARRLKARQVQVRIQGSGDVEVFATEDFDGAVYGSGDIKYYGDPKHAHSHVAGSGSIRKR